jgi:hypothetical protein
MNISYEKANNLLRVSNILPVRTSKTRNAAFNSVEHPDLFMCHRSEGCIQKHISPDCNLDLIYNVAGVNGCIFGVSDLQSGCAAPKSTIQGPSGTFE